VLHVSVWPKLQWNSACWMMPVAVLALEPLADMPQKLTLKSAV
jgi:hypothetical protein